MGRWGSVSTSENVTVHVTTLQAGIVRDWRVWTVYCTVSVEHGNKGKEVPR